MTGIDPGDTFELIPDRDAELDNGEARRFLCRHLSCREWRDLHKAVEKFDAAEGAIASIDEAIDGLRLVIVAWANVKHKGETLAFDLGKLDLALTARDAGELFAKAYQFQGLTGEEIKKFGQPSGSDTGSSAESAEGAADAETSPPSTAPPSSSARTVTIEGVTSAEAPAKSP